VEVIAKRAARLAKVAETTKYHSAPRYVIGTEVPIPGGATDHEEGVSVTKVDDARRTLEVARAAFVEAGLEPAWERVVALVVQPGVEFGDDFILDYDPKAARDLARFAETTPFVYEAHSTDYQPRDRLAALVRDHFAILKVGPALTYAYREAVFGLAAIEAELVAEEQRSRLVETLEAAMLRDPCHWQKHYAGTPEEQAHKRLYSRSDRVRYYWVQPEVQAAISRLLKNLDAVPLPLSLIGQFLPDMYPHIHAGYLPNSVANFIVGWINHRLEDYSFASGNAVP
jgi:D-tagatose-1,6-bisphosphate aldolase subunit GatZ/KbaZ